MCFFCKFSHIEMIVLNAILIYNEGDCKVFY